MKSFVLFNNKAGVGKTTITFNLAHSLARSGREVLLIDCDPQCGLSSLALSEADLDEAFAAEPERGRTIAACLEPVRGGRAEVNQPELVELDERLALLPGDLLLGRFEAMMAGDVESTRSVTATLERFAVQVGRDHGADVVIFDVGSNLGALNRAVLLACDAVVVPLVPDTFGLRGLVSVGEAVTRWRDERDRDPQLAAGGHAMRPLGYLIQRNFARDGLTVHAHVRWSKAIRQQYRQSVLGVEASLSEPEADLGCLGYLRNFGSLAPLAQAAHKPVFDLKHADGVLGAQFQLVERARAEFKELAETIVTRLMAD